LFLCRSLEPGEGVAPEGVHPVPEDADPSRVELVEMPRPASSVTDEADVLEDAEVLRDGRPADRKPGSELANGSRPRAEELEDLPPRRVAQRVERMVVSIHLP